MDDNHVVTVDGHHLFRAFVEPAGQRWNGWLVPHFSRPEAESVVAWLNGEYAEHPDGSDRAEWDGEVLVHHTPAYEEEPGYRPERVAPDEHGRYCIGGFSWCWYAACEPALPAGWRNATTRELLPAEEVERLGLDAMARLS